MGAADCRAQWREVGIMGVLFTVVVFILVLSLLVIIHELGHFWTARALGIRVKELGLGFPPRLVALRRGDVEYSINAIPFGGFVRLDGEDDPTVPRGFAGKPIWARVAVIVAGSAMNLLLAWAIFTVLVALPFERIESGVGGGLYGLRVVMELDDQ